VAACPTNGPFPREAPITDRQPVSENTEKGAPALQPKRKDSTCPTCPTWCNLCAAETRGARGVFGNHVGREEPCRSRGGRGRRRAGGKVLRREAGAGRGGRIKWWLLRIGGAWRGGSCGALRLAQSMVAACAGVRNPATRLRSSLETRAIRENGRYGPVRCCRRSRGWSGRWHASRSTSACLRGPI